MKSDSRSLRECLDLARKGAEACASKYEAIAERVDPRDGILRNLMWKLASEARSRSECIRVVQGSADRGGAPAFTGGDSQAFLRRHIPSLQARFGEGYLSRDSAMYFAECLEEESSRFLRTLASAAPDAGSRLFFEKAALGEWSRLKQLRTVLLEVRTG